MRLQVPSNSRMRFCLRKSWLSVLLLSAILAYVPASFARPSGPERFCESYDSTPFCLGNIPACRMCHDGPPLLNAYGNDVASALWDNPLYTSVEDYEVLLSEALVHVEGTDSDGDGLTNLEEIELGLWPADAQSHWLAPLLPEGEQNPYFDVGQYDYRFSFRRVLNLYCGRPPAYEDMMSFNEAIEAGSADAELRTTLWDCLESTYWLKEGLPRLADAKIRPLKAVGFDGLIPLADYEWDYRLFSHLLSGDRDARGLLRADYHIDEEGRRVDGPVAGVGASVFGSGGQPLVTARRAGMLTTQWFLVIHTMFSALPRTTAAQAYRAYLGVDIAKGEGILPVANEPRDVDEKGVDQPSCAVCHSTIDPLSYAFAAYHGIGTLASPFDFDRSGTYDPTRTPWGTESSILGEPVTDLVSWAQVAAESELFQRNLVLMFWQHALGRAPLPDEQEDFRRIWQALPSQGYRANQIIEELVFTSAFGVP